MCDFDGCGVDCCGVLHSSGEFHHEEPSLRQGAGKRKKVVRHAALPRNAALRHFTVALDTREARDK